MVALLKTTQIQEPSSATVNISLDSSGNVGIGTTSPSYKLDVQNSSSFSAQLKTTSGNYAQWQIIGAAGTTTFGTDSNTGFVTATSNIPLAFGTNNIERARIDSSGYMQGTVNGLSAGRIPAMQYFRLNSDLAGANVSTAQNTFGVGVTLVGSTQYAFEFLIILAKTAGTTSHSPGIGYSFTGTVNNMLASMYAGSANNALPVTNDAPTYTSVSSITNAQVSGASTTATRTTTISGKGTISVGTGGVLTPQYTLSAAPGGAYSTVAGSYFAIYPLAASGSNVNIGSWA